MSKINLKRFYSKEIYLLILFNIFLIPNYYFINAKECNSIFVRENITALRNLKDCTVVKGNIIIALIKNNNYIQSNYDRFQFPKLREVTEFILIYDDEGIETLGNMFPNLAIIRGERLFENYALGIFEMHDLKEIGLKSLVTIQKGHVFIDRCPKLCHVHTINWDVMTKSYGSNHIQKIYVQNCPNCDEYCSDKYCWGPNMCQLNYTTNLSDLSQNTLYCHTECLLGCFNTTDMDCVVCKNFNDHGKCVQSCPKDKYTHFEHKRCYNAAECLDLKVSILEDLNHFRECVLKCPYGYTIPENSEKRECKKCRPNDKCPEITCIGGTIQYLQDAQDYKGCKTINGSLKIKIDGRISEKLLETYLGDIKVITHYLKIYNMPHINSLQFLSNLEQIHGDGLHNELFGLLIYDNHNLTNLLPNRNKIKIIKGGIYIHSNDNLCNNEIVKLQENLEYDKDRSHITFNEEEINCSSPTIYVNCSVVSHNTVQIVWRNNSDIFKNSEVFYRELKDKDLTIHNSSNETTGFKFTWKREKLLNNIYFDSTKKYLTNNITNLKQNTKYELLIKTFGEITENQLPERQSKICTFKTNLDFPQSPTINTKQKTTNSILLEWDPNEYEQYVTNYIIEISMNIDNQEYFDKRDYCKHFYPQYSFDPPIIKFDNSNDYCMYEKSLEQIENDEFYLAIKNKYKCSDDNLLNCNENDKVKNQQQINNNNNNNNYVIQNSKSILQNTIKLGGNQTNILIQNLKHYTVYIFKLYACNQKGCGSYTLYHDRTLPLSIADNIDFVIVEKSIDDPNECHVTFYQPKIPNGCTVAYQIYMQRVLTEQDIIEFKKKYPKELLDHQIINSTVECITRKDHEKNNNKYIIKLDKGGYHFAIRSISLAGPGKITEWRKLNITKKLPVVIINSSSLGTTAIVFVTILCSIIGCLTLYFIIKYITCKCSKPKLPSIRFRAEDNDVLIEDSIELTDESQRLSY